MCVCVRARCIAINDFHISPEKPFIIFKGTIVNSFLVDCSFPFVVLSYNRSLSLLHALKPYDWLPSTFCQV